ncbi:MAG: hypothetical protein J6N21_20095 [Butyrivibrio sp.]|nr:hypothetical protein [Butyrivibrio sp.]
MLHLKRITHFNEYLICKVSGEVMMYGDFYYEDDEDGLIVSANYYHNLKKQKKEDNWDYSELNAFESQRDYAEALKEKERELFEKTVLNRAVAGHEVENREKGFDD